MRWLENLKARFRWAWVGTVEGQCVWDRDGTKTADHVYWNLYQRGDGKRRFEVIGNPDFGTSSHVKQMRAAVRAWKMGGPYPPLHKSPTAPRQPTKLISFPGGKAGTT